MNEQRRYSMIPMRLRRLASMTLVLALLISGVITSVPAASADIMDYRRDRLSTSAPSATSSHTIQFTLVNSVPADGTVQVQLLGPFDLPAGFDHTDADFAVSTTSPPADYSWVDRDLAGGASTTASTFSIQETGSAVAITIDLNGTEGIGAGESVMVELGHNATHQHPGNVSIENPPNPTSYKINMSTRDSGNNQIDGGFTYIAITPTVSVGTTVIAQPPKRSNGLPTSTIAAGNDTIELSLETNELATCRYATSTGVAYADMTGMFDVQFTTIHTAVKSGFQNGQSYTYYVRCIDTDGNANDDDYPISFSLEQTPDSQQSTGELDDGDSDSDGSSGGGGGGAGPGGPYPEGGGPGYLDTATVQLSGVTAPNASVDVLLDGEDEESDDAGSDGTFEIDIEDLERGTYTFALTSEDSEGRSADSHAVTLSVTAGTENQVSDLVLPPTIALASTSVAVGGTVEASGSAVAGGTVNLSLVPEGESDADAVRSTTATSTSSGEWSASLSTQGLEQGTYRLQAQSETESGTVSDSNSAELIGVGEEPTPAAGSSDLNNDDAVNLTDFSILLFNWGTSAAEADINADGTVDLTDFSIMLSNWTG